jgi:diguanylate cyclase (GGDEF)-like protein
MDDGGWVATHQDITDLRRVEAEVDHLAKHDALTGLPNRSMLRSQIDEALQHLGKGEDVAVMSLDIDRFQSVNDTLGHPVGDELLKLVAKRLTSCARGCDTIARLGNDEFAMVQVGADQPEDATRLAQRICDVIKRPFDINGHEVIVGASIGISLAPADGVDPDLLLKNAGMALYEAKRYATGSYSFFKAGMDSDVKSRRELDIDLRKAFELGQFELHYQPLQNLETGNISGLEALLRWRHPERGFVSPAEFIPIAEETELIVPLGEWVIRQACADASLWPDNVNIAVNVSPVQFRKGNLVPIVMSALGGSEMDPRRLELEITESVLLNNSESTLNILHQLRSLGVRIAMDDFGTGYSSLSYLRSFPFDKIKIDGSFIHDLPNSEDALAIVRAVASLGKSLRMTTTAECVETVEQRDYVAKEGYTEIQGYFFSPPRPAEEISEQFFSEKKQASGSALTEESYPDPISKSG